MSMIDPSSTLAALSAARAGATGANLHLIDESTTAINAKVAALSTRWSSSVDAAKSAWLSEAEDAFDNAQVAADYVTTASGGTPASTLTFDPYSSAPIVARLSTARATTSSKFLQHLIDTHTSVVTETFAQGSSVSEAYVRPIASPTDNTLRAPKLSPASLERDISALVADAAVLLDSL